LDVPGIGCDVIIDMVNEDVIETGENIDF